MGAAYCAPYVVGPADAEDATQEIFLKAITHLGGFRQESGFRTWLYRIAANHLLDRCRTTKSFDQVARMLAGTDDTVPALRAYEHERYKRVSGLVKRSRLQGWIGQQKSAFACGIRNLMMQWTPAVIMQRAYEMNVDFEL